MNFLRRFPRTKSLKIFTTCSFVYKTNSLKVISRSNHYVNPLEEISSKSTIYQTAQKLLVPRGAKMLQWWHIRFIVQKYTLCAILKQDWIFFKGWERSRQHGSQCFSIRSTTQIGGKCVCVVCSIFAVKTRLNFRFSMRP